MADGILMVGLILIFLAAEMSLRGAIGIARQFDVPPLYTGIFIIAVLTVFPELFLAFRATTMGHPDMAVGGIVGTNLINLTFIMGLGALIHPMASPPKVIFRDGGALLIGCAALILSALIGEVSRWIAVVLLLLFVAYMALLLMTDWRRAPDHSVPLARALFRSAGEMPTLAGSAFLFLLGLIALALGAHLSVLGGMHLAVELGWSDATIGLVMIGAGLSAPKLLVTLVAAFRSQTTIAVGQLIAASAFNLLLVMGLVALMQPLAFPEALRRVDVFVLAAASSFLLPLLAMRWRLSRPRGVLLMVVYGCYLVFVLGRQGLSLH